MSESLIAPSADPSPPRPQDGGLPRVLGELTAAEPGPTLILVGSLHGNEPAGTLAIRRLLELLAADDNALARGRVVGLTGNRQALRHRQRFLAYDLNRCWLPGRVERLRGAGGSLAHEDAELRELDREIERLRHSAEGPVYLLDLHTTSGPELPFATLDDTLPNRELALRFPVPVVMGIEEELAGTLASYVHTLGVVTAGFESGQHDDPRAVERAEAAAWIALEATGLLAETHQEKATVARRQLAEACNGLPDVVEIRYRHGITPEDGFRMDPGWVNFQAVAAGQALGTDRSGPVAAPFAGRMLMPLYQALGNDGFFLVRPVHPAWLEASAVLRRLRPERFLHWLPGVRRHPELAGGFIADRRYARWLALELFHLLGFQRRGVADQRYLTMVRRLYDPPG